MNVKELKIDYNEYLTDFYIGFNNEVDYISQLGFSTNKNKRIFVGNGKDELKVVPSNGGNNLILGTFDFIN